MYELKSPISAQTIVASCHSLQSCKMAVAICFAESKIGTDYFLPEIENRYFNCGGIKSPEILKTHTPDERGSWLRKFNSWSEYFAHASYRLQKGYFEKNCETPECIARWYVGRYSQSWVNNVKRTLDKL